jgi:hypothetical protein
LIEYCHYADTDITTFSPLTDYFITLMPDDTLATLPLAAIRQLPHTPLRWPLSDADYAGHTLPLAAIERFRHAS